MKKYILVLLPILFVSFVIFAFDIETNPSNITLYMKKINIASDGISNEETNVVLNGQLGTIAGKAEIYGTGFVDVYNGSYYINPAGNSNVYGNLEIGSTLNVNSIKSKSGNSDICIGYTCP